MIRTSWIRTSLLGAALLSGHTAWGSGPSIPDRNEPVSLPSVDQVFDKSLQATGGFATWKQLTSLHLKGSISISPEGIEGTLETFSRAPNKLSECVKSNTGFFSCRVYDGVDGWQDDSRNGLQQLQGEPLDQLERDADFYAEVDWRQKYAILKVVRRDVFDGQSAYVIEAQGKDGRMLELYFAKDSGYQIGRREFGATPEQVTTIHLKDYRQIASPPVRIATNLRIETRSKSTRITIEEITANAEIADWVFAKPEKSLRDARSTGKEGHPDNGKVADGIYRNDFFGFDYTLPRGWFVASEETQQVMDQTGKQSMGSGTNQPNVEELVRKRNYHLVTATELPFGTPGKANRSVELLAFNVAYAPGIQRGMDYLLTMRQGTAAHAFAGRIVPDYDGEPSEQTINGFVFARQNLSIKIRTAPVYEIMYAVKLKNFIVYFVSSATSKEGVEEAALSMQSFRQASFVPAKP